MVAVGDDVAVIEGADRADVSLGPPGGGTDRTWRPVETPGEGPSRIACRRRYRPLAVSLGWAADASTPKRTSPKLRPSAKHGKRCCCPGAAN